MGREWGPCTCWLQRTHGPGLGTVDLWRLFFLPLQFLSHHRCRTGKPTESCHSDGGTDFKEAFSPLRLAALERRHRLPVGLARTVRCSLVETRRRGPLWRKFLKTASSKSRRIFWFYFKSVIRIGSVQEAHLFCTHTNTCMCTHMYTDVYTFWTVCTHFVVYLDTLFLSKSSDFEFRKPSSGTLGIRVCYHCFLFFPS